MWTLEAMQRFVCKYTAEAECKSCAGSHKHGKLLFKACLVIYPEFDPDKLETVARVGCDVMLESKTCFCTLTPEEFEYGRKQAHLILMKKLQTFLEQERKPPAPPPMENDEDFSSAETALVIA